MHPSLNQFEIQPDEMDGVTGVVLSHPRFGTTTYYFPLGAFQENLRTWMVPAWVNGFAVMVYPTSI